MNNDVQYYVDTHAHLSDEQFADDALEVITRAAAIGVTRVVNVAFSRDMWDTARSLSDSNPGVSNTLGVHPNNAGEWSPQVADAIREAIARQRPSAIGETGLDYYWNAHPREKQIEAFSGQIDVAREFDLPLINHMRGDVEADIRQLLSGGNLPVCVFHSFDGTPELADWAVANGWYLGAGGLMTRRSARGVQAILKRIPLDQLLLETDSPYLSPTGWTEKRNTPESIPIIAGHLARLRDTSIETIARVTTENALRVFQLEMLNKDQEMKRLVRVPAQ
jgi:TatD DNase family protein